MNYLKDVIKRHIIHVEGINATILCMCLSIAKLIYMVILVDHSLVNVKKLYPVDPEVKILTKNYSRPEYSSKNENVRKSRNKNKNKTQNNNSDYPLTFRRTDGGKKKVYPCTRYWMPFIIGHRLKLVYPEGLDCRSRSDRPKCLFKRIGREPMNEREPVSQCF